MIQTNIFVIHFNGLNFDIDPNDTKSPSGSAKSKVRANSLQFTPNPSNNEVVTD